MVPADAHIEAEQLLAFERLCRNCQHLIPHALYEQEIHLEDGPTLIGIIEDEASGPMCQAGLAPLMKDGGDCPYFRVKT